MLLNSKLTVKWCLLERGDYTSHKLDLLKRILAHPLQICIFFSDFCHQQLSPEADVGNCLGAYSAGGSVTNSPLN